MSYVYAVTADHPLCGTWVSRWPDDSDDHRSEYTIKVVEGQFRVSGVSCPDGEEFLIYDVGYDGEWIRFVSHMPSTGRTGRSWMRVVDKDKIEFRFTFTDTEYWIRKPFTVVEPRNENEGLTNGCTEPGDSASVPGRTPGAPGR